MKKLLNISVIAALAVLPFAANAAVTDADPGATNASAPMAEEAPKYSLAAAASNDDTHMATAGYVKGAYNAAIKAINRVSETAGNAADKDLSNITTAGENVVKGLAAEGGYNNTENYTSGTIGATIKSLETTAGNAADKDLSNLSATGTGVITTNVTTNAASGTFTSNQGLSSTTLGTAIDELANEKADKATTLSGYGITDGANTDLGNLSATGKANVSAQGTYDANTNYTAGTVGAAIKSLQTGGATQAGVENTIETATITATVPTLTVWDDNTSTGTASVTVSSIAATYAEPANP